MKVPTSSTSQVASTSGRPPPRRYEHMVLKIDTEKYGLQQSLAQMDIYYGDME